MTPGCLWLPSPYILASVSEVCHMSNKSVFLVTNLNHQQWEKNYADITGFTCNLSAHSTPCYYNEAVENDLKRHPFSATPGVFGCLKAPKVLFCFQEASDYGVWPSVLQSCTQV